MMSIGLFIVENHFQQGTAKVFVQSGIVDDTVTRTVADLNLHEYRVSSELTYLFGAIARRICERHGICLGFLFGVIDDDHRQACSGSVVQQRGDFGKTCRLDMAAFAAE